MKSFLIAFCSIALIASVSVFAYNSDRGPAKQKDGITEPPQASYDSAFYRGKYLVDPMHYSKNDLDAIAVYLNCNR